nr:caspase family protein [Alphaproteobacteria bacterium]
WDGAYGVSMAPSGSCQRWGGFSAYIEDGRVTVTNSRLSGMEGKVSPDGKLSASGTFRGRNSSANLSFSASYDGKAFVGRYRAGTWCSGDLRLALYATPSGSGSGFDPIAALAKADALVSQGKFSEAVRAYGRVTGRYNPSSNYSSYLTADSRAMRAVAEAFLKATHLQSQGLAVGIDLAGTNDLVGNASQRFKPSDFSKEMQAFADQVQSGLRAMSAGTMISKAALLAEDEIAFNIQGRWEGAIHLGSRRCPVPEDVVVEVVGETADVYLAGAGRPTMRQLDVAGRKALAFRGEVKLGEAREKRWLEFEARFHKGELVGRYWYNKRCGGSFVLVQDRDTQVAQAGGTKGDTSGSTGLKPSDIAKLLRAADKKLLAGDVAGAAADYARGATAGAALTSGASAAARLVIGEVMLKHAIMLEQGLGGPRDPARAASVREQAKRWIDPDTLTETLTAFTVVAQAKAGASAGSTVAAVPAQPPPAEPSPVAEPAPPPAATEIMAEAGLKALQEDLALLGHYQGAIDGLMGPGTERAISAWQGAAGHPADGRLTMQQWSELQLAARTARRAAATAASTEPAATDPDKLDLAFWEAIKDSERPEDYQAYLEAFPDGRFAPLARLRARKSEVAAVPAAKPKPELDIDFGRYHALVIGNNAYTEITPLNTAVRDAQAVAEVLERDYGFKVTLLTDATRYQVLAALSKLRKQLTDQDNLLVYYAGHGVLDEEADLGYWLPVDAEPDITANWIANHDLTAGIRAIKAKHVMVVADSCYSGTLVRAAKTNLNTENAGRVALIERMAGKRSRTVLTSGGLEPVVDSGPSGHSVFANAFLKQLRTNDGVLDGQTLFAGLRREVILEADQTPAYADMRRAGHKGGDFLFVRQ